MFNIHLTFANEFHKGFISATHYHDPKDFFENRKFCRYYFLRKLVPAKKGNFKVGEIWEFGNMTFTVFIFTTATLESANKIKLLTAFSQNFYYLVSSDATDLLYLYNRIQTRKMPL